MRDNEPKVSAGRRRAGAAAGASSALSLAALLCYCGPALAQRTHAAPPEKGTKTMGLLASDARLKFENAADAPLVIREVKVRRAAGASANGAAVISVTVANTTDRPIASFGLAFVRKSKERAYTERSEVVEPNGTYSFDALALTGKTSGLAAKIKGVRFADGGKWGDFSPAPPPPAPPAPPAN